MIFFFLNRTLGFKVTFRKEIYNVSIKTDKLIITLRFLKKRPYKTDKNFSLFVKVSLTLCTNYA